MCAGLQPDSKEAVKNLELDFLLIGALEAAGPSRKDLDGWQGRNYLMDPGWAGGLDGSEKPGHNPSPKDDFQSECSSQVSLWEPACP